MIFNFENAKHWFLMVKGVNFTTKKWKIKLISSSLLSLHQSQVLLMRVWMYMVILKSNNPTVWKSNVKCDYHFYVIFAEFPWNWYKIMSNPYEYVWFTTKSSVSKFDIANFRSEQNATKKGQKVNCWIWEFWHYKEIVSPLNWNFGVPKLVSIAL